MGLVRTWSRQVARAAGASLIAPLALLLTAGVVASGGGLGGLDSLGQVASGPSLPDTGMATASSSSIEGAEIVGADVTAPSQPVRSTPRAVQLAAATPPAPTSSPAEVAGPGTEVELGSPERSPPTGTGDVLINQAEGDPPPAATSPGDDLQETTQGLEESVSEPLPAGTNQLLDVLLLLRGQRR